MQDDQTGWESEKQIFDPRRGLQALEQVWERFGRLGEGRFGQAEEVA
jgi:hypothetical protein